MIKFVERHLIPPRPVRQDFEGAATLQQRFAALEHENARLKREIAELRASHDQLFTAIKRRALE
jgi:predicted transcriptional regulator